MDKNNDNRISPYCLCHRTSNHWMSASKHFFLGYCCCGQRWFLHIQIFCLLRLSHDFLLHGIYLSPVLIFSFY